MEDFLTDHNAMSKRPMNLAMFLYACEHISRICRVLKQPGAHLMTVGVGGSGRQSLSKLAAFIMGMGKVGKKVVILLDVDKVLSLSEIKALGQVA